MKCVLNSPITVLYTPISALNASIGAPNVPISAYGSVFIAAHTYNTTKAHYTVALLIYKSSKVSALIIVIAFRRTILQIRLRFIDFIRSWPAIYVHTAFEYSRTCDSL